MSVHQSVRQRIGASGSVRFFGLLFLFAAYLCTRSLARSRTFSPSFVLARVPSCFCKADCHDWSCLTNWTRGKALSNFSAYNARFKMPSGPSGGNSNMWYSFDAGPVHFVSLDLETAYPGAVSQSPSQPASQPASLPASQPPISPAPP